MFDKKPGPPPIPHRLAELPQAEIADYLLKYHLHLDPAIAGHMAADIIQWGKERKFRSDITHGAD